MGTHVKPMKLVLILVSILMIGISIPVSAGDSTQPAQSDMGMLISGTFEFKLSA
jgi:hypothetical protein